MSLCLLFSEKQKAWQCVYEEGKTEFDLKDLKEESAVEVTGVIAGRASAAGFELRLTGIRVLSEPAETMPIAINKWKMNTSLETKTEPSSGILKKRPGARKI